MGRLSKRWVLARRPEDLDVLDGGGLSQPDLLLERVAAETSAGADGGMDVPLAGLLADVHPNAGAHGAAVRLHALEQQRDPMVAMPGVQVEHVLEPVALHGAAHVLENILIAVVVQVAEGHAVSLLEMAKSAGDGDILEKLASALRNMRLGTTERRSGSPVPQ